MEDSEALDSNEITEQKNMNNLPPLIVSNPFSNDAAEEKQEESKNAPTHIDKVAAIAGVLEEIKELNHELFELMQILKTHKFYSQKRAKNVEMQITYLSEVNSSIERRAKRLMKNNEIFKQPADDSSH